MAAMDDVNIEELPMPQLEMLKGQLEQEVEFLSSSIDQFKQLQTKFSEAKESLNVMDESNEGKEMLVPLTRSLYVPGQLSDTSHVMINAGAGFYVEKSVDDARDYFKRKMEYLTEQIEKIQPKLHEKLAMKQVVLEMWNQKLQQQGAAGTSQGATSKD